MKNVCFNISMLATVSMLLASGCTDKLANDFVSPPETMTTGVYWYWMSDNISKDGVIKDLRAMKQAGINAAFIGNIGGEGAPYGEVKLFSEEWWEVLHTAMKTAGELGIEIGMFNCPGWSHSGGPWIKAEQSMRHLVTSETQVTGGGKVKVKLPVPSQPTQYKDWSNEFISHEGKPSPYFQDVRTLAIPVPEDYRFNLFDAAGARITTTNMRPLAGASLDRPVHDAPPTSPLSVKYVAPRGREASITLRLPHPHDARSLLIYPASHCRGEGELQAKVNGQFVTVATYPLYRVFPIPSVGFTPFAPTVVGFDKVTSDEYRILFRHIEHDAAIGTITLSPIAALDKYPEKTLARMYQSHNPPWTEYKWTAALPVPASHDSSTAIAPAKVVDITDKLQPDGTLVWDAPEGNWLVLRMGMVPNEVYIEQPYEDKWPGVETWFGVEFNRKNTWFRQIDLFTTYLKRCGVMLEQGFPVTDVAYFIGEDVPVNTGPLGLSPNAAKDSVGVHILPQGYHADYVNADVIINAMKVKDGRIVLPHGISYRILVLPPVKTMRPEVLKSIERFSSSVSSASGVIV